MEVILVFKYCAIDCLEKCLKVVVFVFLSMGSDDNLQKDAIKSFRVLRVLRPLKAINKSKKLKVRFSVISSLQSFTTITALQSLHCNNYA